MINLELCVSEIAKQVGENKYSGRSNMFIWIKKKSFLPIFFEGEVFVV